MTRRCPSCGADAVAAADARVLRYPDVTLGGYQRCRHAGRIYLHEARCRWGQLDPSETLEVGA